MRTAPALAVLASLLLFSAATADTILVDVNGGGDFLEIGRGIGAAADGDTVLVAPGEYVGYNNRDMDPAGKDLTIIGTDGWESTIINCEGEERAINFRSGEDSTLVVGFTFTNGLPDHDDPGGAVICREASPTFQSCMFVSNHSGGGGGAVHCYDASPTFVDCQFIDNTAIFGGAFISKGSGHPVLTDVVFDGNEAEWTGGMRCEGGGATLTNVTFQYNESSNTGGGFVGAGGGSYSLSHCVFLWNAAIGDIGGGVACGAGSLAVTNCTFYKNRATSGSAAATKNATSDLVIDSSILSFGLTADVLACVGAPPTVTHSCIYGNAGGDSLCGYYHDNLFTHPIYCDPLVDDFTLFNISPCLPDNNPWGVTIGAFGEGCFYPGPPPAPNNLTAVPGDDMATVSWQPVVFDVLDYYRLERDDSSLFGSGTVTFTTTDTVVVDQPLLDGVRYYYRVFAVDTFGAESSASDTVSCLIEPVPPSAPGGLVTVVWSELVELSWQAGQEHDLDHYVVYRDTTAGVTEDDAYAISAENTFPDSVVANYTAYYYRVTAVDTSGLESELSGEVRAVPHGRPPAVAWLTATPGDTSVLLTWRSVEPPCEQYYKVYRDTTPDMLSLIAFYDGFEMYESGSPPPSPPWNTIAQAGTEVLVTDSLSAEGTQSVAVRDSSSGYLRLFASLGDSGHPAPRVRFAVRPGPVGIETNLVQFEIFGEAGIGYPAGVLELCDGYLRQWVVGGDPETLAICAPDTWHTIEWYLDCVPDTYGVYLDGEKLVRGVPFFNKAETLGIFEIRTRIAEHGKAWVDELFVGGHVQSIVVTQDTTLLDEPLASGVKYYYKVTAVDTFGSEGFPSEVVAVVPGWVGVGDDDEVGSVAAFFRPGSPNPFGTQTNLRYGVPSKGADVLVRVFDVSGRLVKSLVDTRQDGGIYGLAWDARDESGRAVASGVYFIRAEIGGWRGTRKVAVVR